MQDAQRRLIGLTLILMLWGVETLSLRNIAWGQEFANGQLLPEEANPDGPDRLTRIEQ